MTKKHFFSSVQGYRVQKTLKDSVTFRGVGLHSGAPVTLKLRPAPANHGVVFQRVDLKAPNRVFAHYDAVVSTDLATSLGYRDRPEVRVHTVEHVLAALYATGITNVLVEMDGPEVPILDGSAQPFLDAIFSTGLVLEPYSNPTLKILKPIKIYRNGAIAELLPREALRLTTSIDFPHPAIGSQIYALEVTPAAFRREIGSARTFGFLRDVERLKAMKLAQGASLENVLAFSETDVVNPEGARFPDECVRHKLLDALGDLALCGCWIEGEMVSFRGGHAIHLALLQALAEHRTHWEIHPAAPLRSVVEPALHVDA